MFNNYYNKKKVLVTGHTGFKGTWLCEWLLSLGADVYGIALEPSTTPSLFQQVNLEQKITHEILDINDSDKLQQFITSIRPDIVFHLAAQPLVRLSYDIPADTFSTNLMGTVHVLEALRKLEKCIGVFITTDKCYDNKEWLHSYREPDAMGGHDPYSASKACSELAISSYRKSYFSEANVKVASARAGNVIGGGDWADDRIIPDCIKALKNNETIAVRNKVATRPWQHVLEPLSGYLLLAQKMGSLSNKGQYTDSYDSFNFGPNLTSNRTVKELVEKLLEFWPGKWEDKSDPNAVHEASKLNLAYDKAFHLLNWQPVWDFHSSLEKTSNWYKSTNKNSNLAHKLLLSDITAYQSDAAKLNINWAKI